MKRLLTAITNIRNLRRILELICIIALGISSIFFVGSTLVDNTVGEAATFLALVQANYTERLLGHVRIVESAAKVAAIRSFSLEEAQAYLSEIVEANDQIWSHFILADATGFERVNTLDNISPSSVANQEYFYTPFYSGVTVIAEPMFGVSVNRRLIGIGAAVESEGVTSGVLIGYLRLEYVSDVLNEHKLTGNSYTFMMNSNGTVSGHLNTELILNRNWVSPPAQERPPVSQADREKMNPDYLQTLVDMTLGKQGWKLAQVDGGYALVTFMPLGIRHMSLGMVSPALEVFNKSLLIGMFMVISLILLIIAIALVQRLSYSVSQNIVLRQRAEAANLAKSNFLSNMSHEIRTPLSAILGFAQIGRKAKSENVQDSLRHIENSARHMLSIINDILDMSKIEAGKLVLSNEVFLLQKCLEEIYEIIQSNIAMKNISYICEVDALFPYWVSGDDVRLKQVLLNLLSNAVKFTAAGGEVRFNGRLTRQDSEFIWVEFDISDTGIGMSTEKMSRLFKPFEQGDDRTTRNYGGTGLGLAISKAIAEMMHGDIRVRSIEGEGSTFTVMVRLALAEVPQQVAEAGEEEQFSFAGAHILVVDDIELNREIVMELLGDLGIVFTEAGNGREAVDAFLSSELKYYDVILMDIQMPVLDGYGAAREIRQLERPDAQTVGIVALTANAFREDILAALDAGMNGHVAKPFDFTKLRDAVAEELKKQRSD